MPYRYHYSHSQFMFDRVLTVLWMAARWFLKAVIYLPLWFTGYVITLQLLTKKDSPLIWIALTLLFAFTLYQVLFFIKGIIIACKEKGNLTWVPLFLLCIAFTTALPAWITFDIFYAIAGKLSKESPNLIAWLFSVAFSLYIYSRYHFLLNIAPRLAFPAYQLGIDTGFQLNRSKSILMGQKSRQVI